MNAFVETALVDRALEIALDGAKRVAEAVGNHEYVRTPSPPEVRLNFPREVRKGPMQQERSVTVVAGNASHVGHETVDDTLGVLLNRRECQHAELGARRDHDADMVRTWRLSQKGDETAVEEFQFVGLGVQDETCAEIRGRGDARLRLTNETAIRGEHAEPWIGAQEIDELVARPAVGNDDRKTMSCQPFERAL